MASSSVHHPQVRAYCHPASAFPIPCEEGGAVRTLNFQQLPAATQQQLSSNIDDDATSTQWSESAVVHLHWVLLQQLRNLADPDVPLDEKFDTLDWALTDPALDDRPFSFVNCLKVVGNSPLSPTAYFGKLSVEDVREWITLNARKWLKETIDRYPSWVQVEFRTNPGWVADQLRRNPQWLNEQIKSRESGPQGQLFGDSSLFLAY